MRSNVLLMLLCAAALGACGDQTPAPIVSGADTPVATVTPEGGPVPAGCEQSVPATSVKVPRGLVRPPGVRVIVASATKRADDATITIVEGYVEELPGALVKRFGAAKGIEVLFTEDEEFEAEVMVSNSRYRAFWKVVRVCGGASRFTALYAAERSADSLAGAAPPTKKPIKPR